jgi:toxin ParE1/3/4
MRLRFTPRAIANLIYYTVDEVAAEVVILSIKHPARRREHSDA